MVSNILIILQLINNHLTDIGVFTRINNDEIRIAGFQIIQAMLFAGSEKAVDRQFVGFLGIQWRATNLPGTVDLLRIGGLQKAPCAGICYSLIQCL